MNAPARKDIDEVRFTAGSADDRRQGLLGYLSFTMGGRLRLDGVTLRRTLAGKLTLSYPTRRDGQGRSHSVVRPTDDAARIALEGEILDALGLEREARS